MQNQYDPKLVEKKWRKRWEDKFRAEEPLSSSLPKYYILDMFPYPSGAGLHVGHITGYTASDVMSRHYRKEGYNVLHPMGWDSFGLPAEQYAMRTGKHPKEVTKTNITTYRSQLKRMGFSYDWKREFATSSPSYYKWTQWIFTLLYERGLAYEAELLVNFCPTLGTVLSNEEVENGCSREGGYPVERRPLRQWVLKITDYAEDLLTGLDELDWPESIKALQRNWIGKKEGALVQFLLDSDHSRHLEAFTTRPDTLYGVTFVAVAPEHPLLDLLTSPEQRQAVEEYCTLAHSKSDLERSSNMAETEKTGLWCGSYVLHPFSGELIPVWVADYVLGHVGTGAVMGVPAHDERDHAFALRYSLPIQTVIQRKSDGSDNSSGCWTGEGICIHSPSGRVTPQLNGTHSVKARQIVIDWLTREGKGRAHTHYALRDWLFSRQRYWGEPIPILHLPDGTKKVLSQDELPLLPPEVETFLPPQKGDMTTPLERFPGWVQLNDGSRREVNTMPQWAGSCWYYLRFCDPHNAKQAWGSEEEQYWMPVDLYIGGAEHAVLHLLYARFWHKVLFDCGLVSTREPFKRLRNQGIVVAPAFKKAEGGYVHPDKVSQTEEGWIEAETGSPLERIIEKMSKSKLNGVQPDALIDQFGTDALRLYALFIGPFSKEKVWNNNSVVGCARFLQRFFDTMTCSKVDKNLSVLHRLESTHPEALRLGSVLLHKVRNDIRKLHFNTAVSSCMEFLSAFQKLDVYPLCIVELALHALYPMAPHLASELWEILQFGGDLSYSPYPKIETRWMEEHLITYAIQVNGKLRGEVSISPQTDKEQVLQQAQIVVQHRLEGKEVIKAIFVPQKLINFVARTVPQ